MNIEPDELKYLQIFCPQFLRHAIENENSNVKFVYYTDADTAQKIITNSELWLRNASVMNDFSEISYGLELVENAFSGPTGERFRTQANALFPNVMDEIQELYSNWTLDWINETFLASISVHDSSEDEHGRLSMWRAYGDTALVINSRPMTEATDILGVFSTPVIYLSQSDYELEFRKITEAIRQNSEFLSENGKDAFVNITHHMFHLTAISSKHPGFSEEREWRIYYKASVPGSNALSKKIVVINGVAQEIWAMRLAHEPENGLFHADIPSLLERVIVGPTNYPYVSNRAFVELLSQMGVENAADKVFCSGIPLRTQN